MFIHPSHVKVKTLSIQVRPRKLNTWPPAKQSSNLPTELILPQSEKNLIMPLWSSWLRAWFPHLGRVKTACSLDCKTVRMFAYSSTREQSNKRSVTRMKTESETAERRHGRVRLARFARVKSVCLRIQVSASMSSKRSVTRMKTESETAERWNSFKVIPTSYSCVTR